MEITTSVVIKPRKLLLYGVHGVGKSKLAAEAKGAYVFDLEEGTNDIECARWPSPILTYEDYQNALSWVLSNAAELKSKGVRFIVIDSITKLQELVTNWVCKTNNARSIAEIGGGFGKGKPLLLTEFRNARDGVTALVRAGLGVVIISHVTEVEHTPPDSAAYTEYAPDLHEDFRDDVVRYCDEVFFMRFESTVFQEKGGFGASRGMNKATNIRQLVTTNTGAICAKHRLGLGFPKELPGNAEMFGFYVDSKLAPVVVTPAPVVVTPEPVAQVEEAKPLNVGGGNPFGPQNVGSGLDGSSAPSSTSEPSNAAAAELASTDRF